MALLDMPAMADTQLHTDILMKNVHELQWQLANANIRIKELTEQISELHKLLDAYAVTND